MSDITRGTLEDYLDEGCCLLLGAGVTSGFVGTWDTLLNKLLSERFRSRSVIAPSVLMAGPTAPVIEGTNFSQFFQEESNTEKAEFLLADASVPPSGYRGSLEEWQEEQFSDRVSRKIQENLEQVLKDSCWGPASSCPLQRDSLDPSKPHTLADMYGAYDLSSRPGGCKGPICGFIGRHATTMAVVELCARRNVHFVITYNFDTIVEEMLFHALVGRYTGSSIKQIHIWTYGKPENEDVLRSVGAYSVTYHQGWKVEDLSSLAQKDAIHFVHVHGTAAAGMLRSKKGRLIFSDHSYNVYQETYLSWSNTMLQDVFSRHPAIGIGFSGIDDNFRFFVSNHRKSRMHELTSDDSPDVRIILIKAMQDYRNAIARTGLTESAVIADYTQQCRQMSETYYKTYYGIETHWEDTFLDIAKVLHDFC